MISLVIISPPIALIYHFVSDGLPFRYIKPHPSIVGNCLSYIALLRSIPAVILFVEKRTIRHYILLGLASTLLPPPLPLYNHWAVGYTSLLWIKSLAGTKKAWWLITRFAGCSRYGTMENQHLDLWGKCIFAWILSDNWSDHYEKSLKLWDEWQGTPWRLKNCWNMICSRAWRARPKSSQ